jgi:hypothetical protein
MNNLTNKPIILALLFWVAAFIVLTAYAANGQSSRVDRNGDKSAIRLRMQTQKRTYKVEEPIEISIYLENISDEHSYYVGRDIDGIVISTQFHTVELIMIDANGKKVPLPRGAADDNPTRVYVNGKPIPSKLPTVAEKLAQEYVQLAPRSFYGFRKELVETPLKPGRYQLWITYQETEALTWTEAERKSLVIPVWTQSLQSNILVINVVSK